MIQEIDLPEMGDGITEGTVVSLAFKPGDKIKSGETLAEVETEKAVLGVPASTAGKLVKWYVKEGDNIKVGEKLCQLGELKDTNTTSTKTPQGLHNSDIKENTEDTEKEKKSISPNNSSDLKKDDNKSSTHQQSLTAMGTSTSEQEVNFTDLGDGITTGTVISLSAKIGDTVKTGEALLELETDKAVVPFPSPSDGVVKKIFIKEGQEIKVGDKGLILATSETEKNTANDITQSTTSQPYSSSTDIKTETTTSDTSNRSNNKAETKSGEETDKSPDSSSSTSNQIDKVDYRKLDLSKVHAGPATRKLARELGVDINQIGNGSGRSARILIEDVKQYVKRIFSNGIERMPSSTTAQKPLPDFSKWGKIEKEKTSKLRDTIANAITYSWQTIPHVHQYDNVCIDNIMALQKKWKNDFSDKGSTLSVTPFIIKALAQCLKDFPQFNSSYDPNSKEVILKRYYNVGVAVDTPQGLIVPVIKHVNTLSIFEIGVLLKSLAAQTRDRTVKPEDLRGGCISLSNLGGIGGTHFNPIINWPEVAILGVGRGGLFPVYNKDKKDFIPSMLLPTCLAYDHRVIDGADGARFIVKLKHYLENPDLLLMGIT